MKKFKFLKHTEDSNSIYNGATSQLLIDLYNNEIHINSWIDSKLLHFDQDQNKDCLEFEFKDINGLEYICSIYDDRSFELLQVFKYDDESFEYIDPFEISAEITIDYRYILEYLNGLPNTILEYFNNINSNNGNI
jgi:hypothetical protein